MTKMSTAAPSCDGPDPVELRLRVQEGREVGIELPAAVRERIPVAIARARAKVASLPSESSATARGMFKAAQGARTVAQRVVWLHRWASAWIEPLAQVSACRRGCAHCCHLPVGITSAEARLIAQRTGRPAASPHRAVSIEELLEDERALERASALGKPGAGTPCPFLNADGACSIYEWPTSCRLHASLDDDDLLCQLIDGVQVPVPYVDVRAPMAITLAAQASEQLADIRDFFPPLSETNLPVYNTEVGP